MKKVMTLKILMKNTKFQEDKIISILQDGGIGVIPTDTIYGIVGQALKQKTVEKIYQIRKRNFSKPMIVLINSLNDLELFNIRQTENMKTKLNEFWPGKISIVMPCLDEKLTYLSRGTNSVAFRMPDFVWLRNVISKVGPLVAPSTNMEGMSPATTIKESEKYFGNVIDLYVDGGKLESKSSKLIKIEGELIIELRK